MTITQISNFLAGYDAVLSRRFEKLPPVQQQIACYGIVRHLKYYAKLGSEFAARCDYGSIREILEDAQSSRSIAAENDQDNQIARMYPPTASSSANGSVFSWSGQWNSGF